MRIAWKIKRKTVAVILITFLAFTLSACGNSASDNKLNGFANEVSDTVISKSENYNAGADAMDDESIAEYSDESDMDLDENEIIDVSITIGNQVFVAQFYDNESARTIVAEMPLTLELDDYASQEKLGSLNFILPSASTETPAMIHAGELYLWSGDSLVLFYTTFSNAYSYTKLGYIADTARLIEVLGGGSVEVIFTAKN